MVGWGVDYVLFSFRNFFSDNTRVRIFIFFCCVKHEFFFPEYNIRLFDKNSESDYFFSSTKIRIFFSNIGNQNIFFRKKTVFVHIWNINYIERKKNSHKPTSAYNLPSTCKCLLPKQSIANCNGPLKIYFYIG